MDFFERIREERERLGMTQEAFGTAGGVLKRAVAHYEKGERVPDAAFLEGISRAGADVQYIVTGQRSQQAQLSHLMTAQGIALAHTVRLMNPGVSASYPQELLLLASNIRAGGSAPVGEALSGLAEGAALYAVNVPLPVAAHGAGARNKVTIGGDVGQQVNGDQTVTAPMTFNVGSKPRKN